MAEIDGKVFFKAGTRPFEGPMEKEGRQLKEATTILQGHKRRSVEKIRFDIENLLSADNLMDNDSVAVLQDKLNKYVYGSDFLRVDGELGSQTDKAIKKYKQESRYWGGHSKIDINPERIYEDYKRSKEKNNYEEDTREGGGDQGAY
jgi:hypothetical protein